MDATAFRNSMKAALAAAQADATRKGYTPEDARLATFAVVAFLDESVEGANDPNFAQWSRTPLQEELFGDPASGQIFYQCVDRLLGRNDSQEDADLLEVFALCLLLGYRGRYGSDGPEAVRPVLNAITDKIKRIRGQRPLAPEWTPRKDPVLQPPGDPWMRALLLGTLGALFLAALFFVGFKIALLSGASGLHALASH
jgi:type VI secretion system protein ImpK